MSKTQKIATVFGGTGFIGTQIVRELAMRGFTVKVATRVPERAYFLKPCGGVGQIVPFACVYSDPKSVSKAVKGADVVVNCIGILFEKRKKQSFQSAHAELPKHIAKAARKAGTKNLIHISALSNPSSKAKYAKSKLEGEKGVLKAFPGATILRPSVVFGEGDNFFNMFAKMSTVLPVLPLIGGGNTKFQPVFVGDVADAAMAAIEDKNAPGKVYELGGPDVVSFKEIYEILFAQIGCKRWLVKLPFWVAKIEASFLSVFPKPLLTRDQVETLKSDSVVTSGALSLKDLGLSPTSMEIILPVYLSRYRPGGRFGDKREKAA